MALPAGLVEGALPKGLKKGSLLPEGLTAGALPAGLVAGALPATMPSLDRTTMASRSDNRAPDTSVPSYADWQALFPQSTESALVSNPTATTAGLPTGLVEGPVLKAFPTAIARQDASIGPAPILQLPGGETALAQGLKDFSRPEQPSYMQKFWENAKKESGLTPDAGVLRSTLGYANLPFQAALNLPNIPEDLLHGYDPGTTGPGFGDVLAVGTLATLPFGKLPFAASAARELKSLLGSSPVKGVMKDIEAAMKAGEGGAIDAVGALKSAGLSGSAAKDVAQQIRGRNLLEAVQNYQGSLKIMLAGKAKNTEEAFKNIGIVKMAEDDTFKILRSLGVSDEAAPVFIRHFAAAYSEPLDTLEKLASTPAAKLAALKLRPGDITNPFLAVKGKARMALTKAGADFLLPETVMSSDQSSLRLYNTALQTERDIDQGIYMFQQRLDKALGGMSRESRILVGKRLDGILQVEDVSPKINRVADQLRVNVLESLAGPQWHNLEVKGQYLSDYFPHFLDMKRGSAPKDLLKVIAEKMAVDKKVVFDTLPVLEQGKLLDQAYRVLKASPRQYFFGNISMHRMAEGEAKSYDAFQALNHYVHGAVRKFYMDRLYDASKRLIPVVEDPAIRDYSMSFINGFRGLAEGKGRKTFDTLRTMQAWAKLGLPNFTSPLLNLSQTSINTYTVAGAPTLVRALALRYSDEGRQLLQKSGVFLDVAKHETGEPVTRALQQGSEVLLYLFNKSERFNREVAWLAGYLKAKDTFPKASFGALKAAGRRMVDRTQFVFEQPGRPAFYRSPMGAAAGQFKMFPENQMRFISSLKGTEIPRFALAVALHGGMKGLPGVPTLTKALAGVEAVQWIQGQDMPEKAKEMALGGLPRAAGLSLEQDVGTGFLPGSLKELVPPSFKSVYDTEELLRSVYNKDVEGKNKGVTEAIRNMPGGVGMERLRQVYLAKKRGNRKFSASSGEVHTMTDAELVQYGLLGGKSASEVALNEQREYAMSAKEEYQNAVKMLKYEIRIAGSTGDVDRATRALQGARDAGLLDSLSLGASDFAPALLDQFLSAPAPVKAMLWNTKSFRERMLSEVSALTDLSKETGTVINKAGEKMKSIPIGEASWPYKGAYSPELPRGLQKGGIKK